MKLHFAGLAPSTILPIFLKAIKKNISPVAKIKPKQQPKTNQKINQLKADSKF